VIFMFFGHPGAGKTTLVRRFGELHGVPAIDTDVFMTPEEREAAASGRYTQEMRLANIGRYCDVVQQDPQRPPHVALADGLPNDAARRFLLARFPEGAVRLVLVRTERDLWEERLSGRGENPVNISLEEADAYVRANWEPVAADLPHTVVENVDDPAAVDAQLRAVFDGGSGQGRQ
jgi:hypothetical protein